MGEQPERRSHPGEDRADARQRRIQVAEIARKWRHAQAGAGRRPQREQGIRLEGYPLGRNILLQPAGGFEMGEAFVHAEPIVLVETDRSYISKGAQRFPILPGMICDVEIMTGSRSILSYLFKPIGKAFGEAMTER